MPPRGKAGRQARSDPIFLVNASPHLHGNWAYTGYLPPPREPRLHELLGLNGPKRSQLEPQSTKHGPEVYQNWPPIGPTSVENEFHRFGPSCFWKSCYLLCGTPISEVPEQPSLVFQNQARLLWDLLNPLLYLRNTMNFRFGTRPDL